MWIHLESGFRRDEVRVLVDGGEVFAGRDVRTDYSIGLAEVIEVKVTPGWTDVEVQVPTRQLRQLMRMDTREHAFLGVSIAPDGSRIEFSAAASPPDRY